MVFGTLHFRAQNVSFRRGKFQNSKREILDCVDFRQGWSSLSVFFVVGQPCWFIFIGMDVLNIGVCMYVCICIFLLGVYYCRYMVVLKCENILVTGSERAIASRGCGVRRAAQLGRSLPSRT